MTQCPPPYASGQQWSHSYVLEEGLQGGLQQLPNYFSF